jgi:ribosome maturation factor RimP
MILEKDILLQNLNKLIEPLVTNLGYELYFIEYKEEEGENFLRIYIDKEDGITLEDCERVSRPISDMLDVEDPVPESYYLEVSSPGIFRELFNDRHLSKYIEYLVNIKFKGVFEGKRSLKGILENFDNDYIYIKNENNQIQVPREKISSINLEGSLKEVSTNE